jgi:hypothetical protein
VTDQYRVLKGIDVEELDGVVAGHWEPGEIVDVFSTAQISDLLDVAAIELVDGLDVAAIELVDDSVPVPVPAPEVEPEAVEPSEVEPAAVETPAAKEPAPEETGT